MKPIEYFTFKIPVKKYVAKYLLTKYGEDVQGYGRVIPSLMDCILGFVILNTIASKLVAKVCRGYNNQFKQKEPYQVTVKFLIKYHYFYLTKTEISENTCILLNRYFEYLFKEDLYHYIDKEVLRGISITKALENFAKKFYLEIDEDITFDALKKMEYRYRHREKENIRRLSSPDNSLFLHTA